MNNAGLNESPTSDSVGGISDHPAAMNGARDRSRVMTIPQSRKLREQLRERAAAVVGSFDQSCRPSREELGHAANRLIDQFGLSDDHFGFVLVLIANAAWMNQLAAVPFSRRLLLIPAGVSHSCQSGGCDAAGSGCLACELDSLQRHATSLGYSTLASSGTSDVLSAVLRGDIQGIVGIASLGDLEKAFEQILASGIPCCAIPLLIVDDCEPGFDRDWAWQVLERHTPAPEARPVNLVPLMRATARLFHEDFERLLPRERSATPELARSPLGQTEEVAYDWLANGGKRFRPFITLAAFDAATGGQRLAAARAGSTIAFPDAVCRVAMAIEAFHKASLVHDDIQDDDLFRYGRETLHRSHGLGPAINIGDYLIGLGYRLVGSCRGEFGAEVAADILDCMAQAHIRLCDGQGAEMAWRDRPDWNLSPQDAIQIYTLKTSPAFEAALYAGLRMAGPIEAHGDLVPQFCRQLGVGFQILNDLKDWHGDHDNKLVAGQDALAVRPTVVLALALQSANEAQRAEIRELMESSSDDVDRLARLKELFTQLGAFDTAEALVAKSRARSTALAWDAQPESLRSLLSYLIETVLADERQLIAARSNGDPRPVIQPAHA